MKTVTRHVWEEYVEQAEENRYTEGIREYYPLRKETIERDFGLAKELHGFRYTQMFGKARMEMKAALTYACLNLKKLANKRWKGCREPLLNPYFYPLFWFFSKFVQSRFRGSPKSGFVYSLKRPVPFGTGRCFIIISSLAAIARCPPSETAARDKNTNWH